MPTIRFAEVMAAGAIVGNAIAGSQFEFLARASQVQVYVAQDPADSITVEVFFGQEIELPASQVPDAAADGQGPIVPDDLVVDDVGAPGDRLVIRLQNTGGASGDVRGMVKITPAP